MASEFPDCGVVVSTVDDIEWGLGDYIGATVCSPLLVLVAAGMWLMGDREEEREKLGAKIDDAARQMQVYVDEVVKRFTGKLPQVD